ncbi:MAG: response regulator [Chloroflexota bacterium]
MNTAVDNILIVEDLEQIRELLKVTLTYQGYEVVTARNGEEALEAVAEETPALILTDLLMPKMDGYALIYRLRRNADTRQIPVIVLSATYVSAADKDFALSLGAVRFLEKPVDTADLLLAIGETLADGEQPQKPELDDLMFYTGYQARLERKLQQKTQQFSRTERLLKTLPDSQKPVFQTLLEEARQQKNELMSELEDIADDLGKLKRTA